MCIARSDAVDLQKGSSMPRPASRRVRPWIMRSGCALMLLAAGDAFQTVWPSRCSLSARTMSLYRSSGSRSVRLDAGLAASTRRRSGVVRLSSTTEVLDDGFAPRVEWRNLNGVDIAFPPFFSAPKGIVHFVGGAVVGSLPRQAYGPLIEKIAQEGFCVVATPIPFSIFDHYEASREASMTLQRGLMEVEKVYGAKLMSEVAVFGVGHSLGAKLHILLGSEGDTQMLRRRRANVLISFNNFSAQESVPLLNELRKLGTTVGMVGGVDLTGKLGDLSKLLGGVVNGDTMDSITKGINMALKVISVVTAIPSDFKPDPMATWDLVTDAYAVPRNLVVQFERDTIDQSPELSFKLTQRFPGADRIRSVRLQGTHITPNTPEAVVESATGANSPGSAYADGGYYGSGSSGSTALDPVAELQSTWFEEAGVKEVTRAAAQAAKRELDGLALAITGYLTEMAALPPEPYASLGPGGL